MRSVCSPYPYRPAAVCLPACLPACLLGLLGILWLFGFTIEADLLRRLTLDVVQIESHIELQ